ncbi:MAG: hypothetical protein U0457_01950 [Candidatus Sericytochromatia bacterium]
MNKIFIIALISIINLELTTQKSFAYENNENIKAEVNQSIFFNNGSITNIKDIKVSKDCNSNDGKLWGTGIGLGSGVVLGLVQQMIQLNNIENKNKAGIPVTAGDVCAGCILPPSVTYGVLLGVAGLISGIFLDEKSNSDCKKI